MVAFFSARSTTGLSLGWRLDAAGCTSRPDRPGAGTLRVQVPLRQDDDESLSAGRSESPRGSARQCKGSNRYRRLAPEISVFTRLCRLSLLSREADTSASLRLQSRTGRLSENR